MSEKLRHYEESTLISASPNEIFAYIDDHKRFSSHMSRSSWMMGGGKMGVSVDQGRGQKIGSHIRLSGKAFGIKLFLDEVITHYKPPFLKTWKTVGSPKLLVIGDYKMGVDISKFVSDEIKSKNSPTQLRVFIDYDLPTTNIWLGQLFSGWYARWCVQQILKGVRDHFTK